MAYDELLAARVRALLLDEEQLGEQPMFGGYSFLLGGNVCCGVIGEELIVRVGPAGHAAALAEPGARPFDMGGRSMRGWVFVGADALAPDATLAGWVARGLAFTRTLPAKEAPPRWAAPFRPAGA